MRAFWKSPLSIALLAVLLCVPMRIPSLVNHIYWNVWYKNETRLTPAPPIIVSLDAGMPITADSVASSTSRQAELIDKLMASDAGHIFFDFPDVVGGDEQGDRQLYAVIARAGPRLTLVNRAKTDYQSYYTGEMKLAAPKFAAPASTRIAVSRWEINFFGYGIKSAPATGQEGTLLPAVSVVGAGDVLVGRRIFPDFRINPKNIPIVDAKTVLMGNLPQGGVRHRQIYVTSTNPYLDTTLGYSGHGMVPGAMLDISGAIGISNGPVLELGGIPLLVLFIALVFVSHRLRMRRSKILTYSTLGLATLLLPGILRTHGILVTPDLAMIAALVYAPARSSQKWRHRVQLTNAASGLPNIEALAGEGISSSQDVVAASISQYEQILASLPRELHGECARQIARRLSLGAGDCQIYDNDNGHFVWLENSRTLEALVEHLEGLKALFSSPLVIEGYVLDTNVHFGLDRNIDSKPMSRIQSALASAIEAEGKGKLYEEYGQQRLAQSPWDLSLHARIDEGLRNGDIWLALQPQYDLRSDRISGAEALIRWSDPERGMIPPDAFILQAERAGRIEAITYWVFERAIGMLKILNEIAGPFQISINLSARMVDHPALIDRIGEISAPNDLDCSLVTIEVTETFSMTNREQARINLAALREMGFRLSIDDFGTGHASLTYLAEIPSDEVKLDKRFVQAVTEGRESHIVESMIKLAHALGQEVVAEGIEDAATLEALRVLGCDLAQGYFIARPMRLSGILEFLGVSAGAAGKKAAGYG